MKNLQIFLRNAMRYPKEFLTTMVLMTFQNIFEIGTVLSLAPIVDLVTRPDMKGLTPITVGLLNFLGRINMPQNLYSVMAIVMIFVLLKTALAILVTYSIQNLKYTMSKDILCSSFKEFFGAGWNFFVTHDQSVIGNTFMVEAVKVVESANQMMLIFVNIARACVYIFVAIIVSWKLSAMMLLFGLALSLPVSRLGSLTYKLGKRNTETNNRIFEVISESLSAAKIVIGFGEVDKNHGYLSDAIDESVKVVVKLQVINASISPVFQSLGMGLIMLLLWVSTAFFKMPVGELAIVVFSFYSALPLISQVVTGKNMMLNLLPAYEQLEGLRTTARGNKQSSGSIIYSGYDRDVVLNNVSFNYPKHDKVLKSINIVIPKGKMIALVGKSGAGKSTLIDLLLRLYDPTEGEILLDGIALNEFNILTWRHKIGYVPQDSFLFNMSIRDNLKWSKEDATESQIQHACKMSNADEFIKDMSKGLDTIAGDRGIRLSGGQRQRIALARAMVRNPDILILDEATSSLDSHSEMMIQDAIENIAHETTVVVIAHRLSTVRNADIIYVLDKGMVAESGGFDELLQKNGKFFELARVQGLVK